MRDGMDRMKNMQTEQEASLYADREEWESIFDWIRLCEGRAKDS
jgi:hypothetical protein